LIEIGTRHHTVSHLHQPAYSKTLQKIAAFDGLSRDLSAFVALNFPEILQWQVVGVSVKHLHILSF